MTQLKKLFLFLSFHSKIRSSKSSWSWLHGMTSSSLTITTWSVYLFPCFMLVTIFFYFNFPIFLKSHFPQCLDILSLPLPLVKVFCIARCLATQICKSGWNVFLPLTVILLASLAFLAFFFFKHPSLTLGGKEKFTLMRAVYMWELCTFFKGMRFLFRGDFCIILLKFLVICMPCQM